MNTSESQAVFLAVLDEKPYRNRISSLMIQTLLAADTRTFSGVVRELDWMERLPGSHMPPTKAPKKFTGETLGGLKHTHYSTSEHLVQNLALHWSNSAQASDLKTLETMIEEARRNSIAEDEAWELAGQVASTLVAGYRQRRASRKVTGEWIIYVRYSEQHYYLDLGCHDELQDEAALFNRLRSGCPEFPFCFE